MSHGFAPPRAWSCVNEGHTPPAAFYHPTLNQPGCRLPWSISLTGVCYQITTQPNLAFISTTVPDVQDVLVDGANRMWDFWNHLFDSSGFPPRWTCGAWTPDHGWLHILSDLGVWLAYVAIFCVLGYFVHLVRKVLAMRGPEHLEQEITARKERDSALQQTNDELKRQVEALRHSEERSERKRAQEVAERQATLLDLAHDGIIVRDLESRVTYWNRGAGVMYGWEKVQAVGQISHRLFRTEFPEPLKDIEEKLLRVGQWEGELVHTRQDGGRIVVASRWALQRDEHGKPQAVLEINREITERKLAEEALQRAHGDLERRVRERTAELAQVNETLQAEVAVRGRAEEELRRQTEALRESDASLRRSLDLNRAIMDSMGEGLYAVNGQGLVRYVNPAAERFFGWSAEELMGRKMHDLTHHHHPDGSPFPASDCAGLQVLRNRTALLNHEDVFIRKDGTFFPVVYSVSPLMENDTPVGIVVVFRDDSERREARNELRVERERLALVLRETGVGLWLNPLPLTKLNWDERTRELFFLPPGLEPTAEWFWSVLHPDDREPTRLAVDVALRDQTLYAIDHRAVNPADGEIRWIRSMGRPNSGVYGAPARFDGISYDLTPSKKIEERLRRSEERLALALDAAGMGTWDWDLPTGRITWSEGHFRLLGYVPSAEGVVTFAKLARPRPCRGS